MGVTIPPPLEPIIDGGGVGLGGVVVGDVGRGVGVGVGQGIGSSRLSVHSGVGVGGGVGSHDVSSGPYGSQVGGGVGSHDVSSGPLAIPLVRK